ncbi:MAG: hypothetical protein JW749_12690 [Sedimentisphaerales bacterium]|nr:hypothetical protein [Sedimentisphaerales bacterium]
MSKKKSFLILSTIILTTSISGTARATDKNIPAGRRYRGQIIKAYTGAPSTKRLTLDNPYWKIELDAAGYSDWLGWFESPRHPYAFCDILTGEWAAAIYYDGISTAPNAMWLTSQFSVPDWNTNSDFVIYEDPNAWDDPCNPIVDNDTGYSVIRNGQVEVRIDYEMVDLGEQDANTGEGGSPLALKDAIFVRSERYVLLQTYTIRNISPNTINNLEFYQMLVKMYDELIWKYSVYETYLLNDPFESYEPYNPVHTVGKFRYDVTQWETPPPEDPNHGDWVGFSSTLEPDITPNSFDNGFYGAHSGSGTDWRIEQRTLNGEPNSAGWGIAGATGWYFGSIQPGESVSLTLALMLGAGPISPRLTIEKTAEANSIGEDGCVGPGDEIIYTISYCNEPDIGAINNVSIIDYLPDEVDFNSASDGNVYDPDSHTVTWDLGTLELNETGFVTLKVNLKCPQPGSTIKNSCEIKIGDINISSDYEETLVCNYNPCEYTPICNCPTLTKNDNVPDGNCVGPGENINYSIWYDANGCWDTNVAIIDYLPDEVNYVSSNPNGTYNPENNTVEWNIPLPPDACGCIDLDVQIKHSVAYSTTITNHCEMRSGSDFYDEDFENTSVCPCPYPVPDEGINTRIWWPLEHNWPNMCSPIQVYSYADPYMPEGEKEGEHFNNGRGVMQTFTVPPETGGFMLTDIVITANGEGNPDVTFTLHLFDLDTMVEPDAEDYTPAHHAIPAGTDLFYHCCFKFHNCPDKFVSFTFSPENRVHLEPNHLYAFEIWPTESDPNAAFYWIRSTTMEGTYNGGQGYACPAYGEGPPPSDLSAARTYLACGNRDFVLGVYGIPFDGKAYAPQPRNYATDISVNTTLTWRPGRWAATVNGHKVYFGTDIASIENRNLTPIVRTEPNYTPPVQLSFDTTYYWAVDEVNGTNIWSGDVWRFTTTTPKASNPQPASGRTAEFNIEELELSWIAGAFAAEVDGHRVFFGTDLDEVNLATTATGPPIYRGQQTPDSYNLLDLAEDYTLESGSTYYWRVDEVNDGTAGSPWKGTVWNFTMPSYVVVDSFVYGNQADMNAVWIAGLKEPDCLPDCMSDKSGGAIALDAGKMRFVFDNRGTVACPWSEAKMDYNGTVVDWTAGGLVNTQSLSISVDGNIASSIMPDYDHLYLAIDDSSGNFGIVYCDDTIIQKRQFGSTEGNIWNISLADLVNNGTPGPVDLTDINALYIGTGPRCSWGPPPYTYGGQGVIYIDNIRLYVPRCLPEKAGPDADFTGPANFIGDCIVNAYDLKYFAGDWLDSDVDLNYPNALAPLDDSGHLMVWYKFDTETGTSGTVTVTDSSGNNRYGTIGNPHKFLWASDGASGKCLNTEAGLRTWVEVPTTAYPAGSEGVTFSFWSAYDINYQPIESLAAKWASVLTMHEKVPTEANANTNNDDSQLIESQVPTPWPPNYESGPQVRFVDMRENGRNIATNRRRFSDLGRRWNHYAFIYDDANDSMRVYLNGKLEANEINATLPLWPAPGSFRLGTRSNRYYNPSYGFIGPNWGFWFGKLDDFRIYNYALNENEIQWLATNGTGTRILPLVEPTNLSTAGSPQIINFMDFAIFANDWLMEDY